MSTGIAYMYVQITNKMTDTAHGFARVSPPSPCITTGAVALLTLSVTLSLSRGGCLYALCIITGAVVLLGKTG